MPDLWKKPFIVFEANIPIVNGQRSMNASLSTHLHNELEEQYAQINASIDVPNQSS